MRKNLLRRIIAIVLVCFTLFSLNACGNSSSSPQSEYPKNGERKIVTVEKQAYVSSTVVFPLTVAHYENEPEILYVEIKSIIQECLQDLVGGIYTTTTYTVEETDSTVKLTRENGSYSVIDFVKDTIYFSDLDTFSVCGIKTNPHDMISNINIKPDGQSMFFQREVSLYTAGNAIELNLAERNITLDIYNGNKYIPLQTFNDLYLSPFDLNLAYNGQSLFLISGGVLSADLEEEYYLDQRTPRTDALVEFNYNELCLFLDVNYGLQKEHGINKGFDDYFERIGLKDDLLSNDPVDYVNALGNLCWGYIADSHTSIGFSTPYLGEKTLSEGKNVQPAPEILDRKNLDDEMRELRSGYLGEEVDLYQKVGNTAYVTFDQFTLAQRTSYEDMLKIGDVIDMVYFVHSKIAQDAEIKNVVIDLSCNGGGAVDSAVYLVAWMLGGCDLAVYNSITESKAITSYKADVNLDGVFDEKDTIADKNLYCIVSPLSFSCGNTVPALLKESGRVTILGKTSGGGTCFVRHGLTADGTIFNLSGAQTMAISKNGTFYNIDAGIEPHVYLSKSESIYNREALTEYINNLK